MISRFLNPSKDFHRFHISSALSASNAYNILLELFRNILTENTGLSDETIDKLVDAFMSTVPEALKSEGCFSPRNAGRGSDNYYNLKKGYVQYRIISLQKR